MSFIKSFIKCFLISQQLQTFQKKFTPSKMTAVKNITNGQIELAFDPEDKVGENYKFIRVPGGDVYDVVRKRDPNIKTNYYIENIRTGSFSQISQKYQIQSRISQETQYTTNSFQTEMFMLRNSVQTKLSKSISFFQGIFAGMALLFTITLNLSSSLSQSLVRVQDHSIRVVALIATFGSFFSTIRAKDKYYYIKLRGSSSEVEERYKCYVLCVIQMLFYTFSYIIFNVSHTYSVKFNISGGGYSSLSILTTIYTALCLIGWVVTNINSKKHEK